MRRAESRTTRANDGLWASLKTVERWEGRAQLTGARKNFGCFVQLSQLLGSGATARVETLR
jgi:hypothetical protein